MDLRNVGSGNPGATNLGRALGRRWAWAAFVLDAGKGLLPVLLASRLLAPSASGASPGWVIACGAAAIAGHVYPIWLRFRGGKGVATTFGVLAALAPLAAAIAAAVWLGTFLVTRVVSVASIATAVAFPAATWWTDRGSPSAEGVPLLVFAAVVAVLIIARHRSNLRRLLRGEEHVFGRRARKVPEPGGEAEEAASSEGEPRPDGR